MFRVVYDKELYQMTSLPFVLSSAPHTFATITNWIAEILRSPGVRVIVYLDDFLLASQNRTRLSSQIIEAIELLEHLGWIVDRIGWNPVRNWSFWVSSGTLEAT